MVYVLIKQHFKVEKVLIVTFITKLKFNKQKNAQKY